jgi:hypothetical protein
MGKTTRVLLASGDLAPHVSLSVELVRHADQHGRIMINWPSRPTSTSAAKFPDLVSVITRLLGNAGIELARIQAANGRHTS